MQAFQRNQTTVWLPHVCQSLNRLVRRQPQDTAAGLLLYTAIEVDLLLHSLRGLGKQWHWTVWGGVTLHLICFQLWGGGPCLLSEISWGKKTERHANLNENRNEINHLWYGHDGMIHGESMMCKNINPLHTTNYDYEPLCLSISRDKHACNKLFQRIPVRYIRGFGTSKIYIKILFQEAQWRWG